VSDIKIRSKDTSFVIREFTITQETQHTTELNAPFISYIISIVSDTWHLVFVSSFFFFPFNLHLKKGKQYVCKLQYVCK